MDPIYIDDDGAYVQRDGVLYQVPPETAIDDIMAQVLGWARPVIRTEE